MNEIISFMRDEPLVMTLCPEEESILLNKNVLDHLEQPRQVQILINEEQGMLLLKACSVEDREAVVSPQLPMLGRGSGGCGHSAASARSA